MANWTPDSRHIAIIEYNAEGEDGQLYLLDTEGREPPRRLAPDMDVRDGVAFRPPNGDRRSRSGRSSTSKLRRVCGERRWDG